VIHPDLAARWLAGTGPLASTEKFATGAPEWYEAAAAIRLYARLHEAQERANEADAAVRTAEYVGDELKIQRARERFAERLRELGAVLEEMDEAGLRPPKLDRRWTDRMKKLGIEGG
jgi:hypothetical protein